MNPTRSGRPKARQSLAHVSSSTGFGHNKENVTGDLSSLVARKAGGAENERRKLRSKSLGPGGVEALKESDGNAAKTSSDLPKSILKPTVPLTPPKAIPNFDESRRRSTGKGQKSPANSREELLIDFSTPAPTHVAARLSGIEHVQDPFSPLAAQSIQQDAVSEAETDEEAALKEREAEELRTAQKKRALEARAARRKSMANRRVSFAPEATLHTWNVIEMIEDSTSSSATNSTRRQSSATAAQPPKGEATLTESVVEEPSTPPSQAREPLVKASPVTDREQRRRRRSSRGSEVLLDPAENTSSPASAYGDSSAMVESSPLRVEDSIHSSSDEDGDTAMSMDDTTNQTVQSNLSGSSTESSLDVRLRSAAQMAGTRGIAYDENGDDLSMEIANSTVTNAFQSWVTTSGKGANDEQQEDQEEDLSMEIADATVTNAFQWLKGSRTAASPKNSPKEAEDSEDDSPMDMADVSVTNVFQSWAKAGTQTHKENSTIPSHQSGESASMELADSTVTSAFQPWMRGLDNGPAQQESPSQDQENVNPFKPGRKRRASGQQEARQVQSPEVLTPKKDELTQAESPTDEVTTARATRAKRRKFEDTTQSPFSSPSRKSPRGSPAPKAPSTPLTAKSIKAATPRSLRKEITESLKPAPVARTPTKPSVIRSPFRRTAGKSPLRADITESLRQTSPAKSPVASARKSPARLPALKPSDRTSTSRSPPRGSFTHSPLRPITKPANKPPLPGTPSHGGHFRDVPGDVSKGLESFEDKLDNVFHAIDPAVLQDGSAGVEHVKEPTPQREKIALQDFLKLTSIQFMDLSTTKRRHTIANAGPRASQDGQINSMEACFSAAATTLPLLEMYQHATRELKSYMSSGRKVIRSIEQEAFETQPPLFGDYIDARPDVKSVMDNQFRNGKAHARLQSRQGWYAWRRELVNGLHAGLQGIKSGLEDDAASLRLQEDALAQIVPDLIDQHEKLAEEARGLQERAEEFESEDQESLETSRAQLEALDNDVAQKMLLLGELQQQLTDKSDAITAAAELKTEYECQVAEAERVLDECRSWKAKDVAALRQRVSAIESRTGWTLVTAEHDVTDETGFGAALTMRYRDCLRLFFYPSAFQKDEINEASSRSRRSKSHTGSSAPISLSYSPHGKNASPLTTEQRFVVQLLQSHLHAMAVAPKGSISAKQLLTTVGDGWDLAAQIASEVRLLGLSGITNISIANDEKIRASCMLVHPTLGRGDVCFTLAVSAHTEGGVSHSLSVDFAPKYGAIASILSGAKSSKVREALQKQAASRPLGEGAWAGAVRGLEEWIAQHNQARETKKQGSQSRASVTAPTPQMASPKAAVIETPTPAPVPRRKGLKKPVPMESLLEEAAARQDEIRRQEAKQQEVKREKEEARRHEEMRLQEDIQKQDADTRRQEEEALISAARTPAMAGRRGGALRRTP